MQTTAANNGNYNSFGFSMQTSSGDTINLSMYDARYAEISQENTDTSQTTTYTLSHAYGYKFHYDGNGIDANDQKEIDEAMKVVQPMMDEYLKNVQESASNTNLASLTNTAYAINSTLPTATNANTQNYINDSLLKSMDEVMSKVQNQNEKMLQEAHKLFQSIINQQTGFDLYM
jgi:hypothetical protein